MVGPFDTNAVITPFTAAILAVAINKGAHLAEIVRAGLVSGDHGAGRSGRGAGDDAYPPTTDTLHGGETA